tara:strand:- start:1014 stop:2261 length:1248 start_codon:yes stop_codon:yes gene_type:complete
MDDLLKDAIADAKAVRETALANAKLALEEAFTPRIQSMLSQKIQSEIEDEDEVADADEMSHEGEDHDEEEEAPEAEAPEVAVEPEEGEEVADVADEIEDEDEMAHEGEHEDEDEGYDESKVIEIDGVKYAPVVSEEEEDEDEAMHEEEDEDEGYSEDLDLEAVLAELEGETVTEEEDEEEKDEVKEEEDKEDEDDEVNENDVSSEIGAADNKLKPEAGDSTKIGQGPEGEGSDKPAGKEDENSEIVDDLKEDVEVSEDIDLEEVLKALTEEEDEEDDKKDEAVAESVNEVKTLKADLEEHRNVVKYLRGKLNEVNLLNAKLLFTNKLFRNFGLNNEQKLKVVETFDRATNLREVKLVFSTLAESFGNKVASKPSKKQESKGSASKAVASTKPKTEEVISEGFDMKARFQKLAKIL